MSDDFEYEGDLQPLIAELVTLREALGEGYREIAAEEQQPRVPLPRPSYTLQDQIAVASAALRANLALQERLKRLLKSVERGQDQAENVRSRIKAVVQRRQAASAGRVGSRKSHQGYTGVSWFWSFPNQEPLPAYPESRDLLLVTSNLPLAFPRASWTEDERQSLRDGVLQVVQDRLFNKLLSEMEGALAGGASVGLEEFMGRQAPIRALTLESSQVQSMAKDLSDDDWVVIAHRYVPGKSPMECQLQYYNAARPGLSSAPFTATEDGLLEQLVEQHGEQGAWGIIAEKLSSEMALNNNHQRTALECMSRWQQVHQNSGLMTLEFTELDLARLKALVEKHGVAWKTIAEEFGGGWNADQLMHHWRRHAQRTAAGAAAPRVGKWSADEDSALLQAVALHGRKWAQVAQRVPGRSDVQCRERFINCLDPEIKKANWTDEESMVLREAVGQCRLPNGTIKWSEVASHLQGRTDAQCARRWKVLEGEKRPKSVSSKAKKRKGESYNRNKSLTTTQAQPCDGEVLLLTQGPSAAKGGSQAMQTRGGRAVRRPGYLNECM